jgi:uncharacterized protein (DUF2384 family)
MNTNGAPERIVNDIIESIDGDHHIPSELLNELVETGLLTFDGDASSFVKWLHAYVPAVQNRPADLLSSSVGRERVIALLAQMEFGIVG